MTSHGGLEEAQRQIDAIRDRIIEQNDWRRETAGDGDTLTLLVWMPRDGQPDEFLLRLEFTPDFPKEKPREDFRNPDDPSEGGAEHWPDGKPFRPGERKICIQGVYGCDNDLHAGEFRADEVTVEDTLLAIQDYINR